MHILWINFVLGDKRIKPDTAVKRAFGVILYTLGKSSYGFIAKLFGVTPRALISNIEIIQALIKYNLSVTQAMERGKH